jgi:serine/threonine protein kinase
MYMFEHLVGQNLDRFTLVRKTGEDRLGASFRGYDPNFQRDVTVFILQSPGQPANPDAFVQAARFAARLDHPNLIQVFDFGEAQGLRYLVMEYIPGATLEEMLVDLRRSGNWILLGEAIHLVRQLALARDYVRSQGAALPPLRPSAVRIKPVQSDHLPYLPVITDPGLGWSLQGRMGVSLAPAYVSPEEAVAQNPDARSEVYSLGILLFELVTGQLPFPIRTPEDAALYHPRQPAPSPRALRPDLPEPLERAILTALQKTDEARFPTPSALSAELDQIAHMVERNGAAPPGFERALSLLAPYRQSLGESPTEGVEPARYEAASTRVNPASNIPRRAQVEAILENAQVSVEPGGSAGTDLILRNRGTADGQYRVSVEGIPPPWVLISPELVQLAPGEQREISLTFQPPRSPQSRAGRYPLTVRVADQAPGSVGTEARGTLTVTAYSRFSSRLNKTILHSGETGQITISNLGNTQSSFNINFSDPEGELIFAQPQSQVRLAEGQTAVTEYRAGLRRSRWIGSERNYPYTVGVVSAMGETQTHSGEVITQAIVPAWLIGGLLVLFLCIAGSFALFLARSGLEVSGATATVQAAQTGTAVAALSTIQAGTATADFLANANQATLQAVTATAAWLAGDDDQDGLSNQQELELRTLPNNPDTDGDKLSDADEVNRKTDPLRPDSDGDSLADGAEVAAGLNPLSPDSDQDGLPDAQDPNPLQTSTPAPNQTATAQSIAAQTAAAQTAAAGAFATQTAAAQSAAQLTAAAATAQAATAQAAAGATQAAATAQAAAAQTAAAQTAAAQTAAAGAPATAAAATAQAATLTAQARVRVAYVYSADTAAAQDFQTLLQANGFLVDFVQQADILGANFQPYRAIILGPETGEEGRWGDEDGEQLNYLVETGLPILGIGEGGFTFLTLYNEGVDGVQGITVQAASAAVENPSHPIWNTPKAVQIPGTGIVVLYNTNVDTWAVTSETPGVDQTRYGRLPDNPTQFTLLRQGALFMLWGYSGPPANMTSQGQPAFVNALFDLLPDN